MFLHDPVFFLVFWGNYTLFFVEPPGITGIIPWASSVYTVNVKDRTANPEPLTCTGE